MTLVTLLLLLVFAVDRLGTRHSRKFILAPTYALLCLVMKTANLSIFRVLTSFEILEFGCNLKDLVLLIVLAFLFVCLIILSVGRIFYKVSLTTVISEVIITTANLMGLPSATT